jgi:hypothetical protein
MHFRSGLAANSALPLPLGYGMHGSWFLFLHSSDSMAAVSSGVFEWNCLVVETHVLKPVV